MLRRRFLEGVLGAAITRPGTGSAQNQRLPNIVLLVADGWRGQTLPFAGDQYLRAPNVQRLAAAGTVFERAYTVNPERFPARAALLTGRYPHRCGVVRNGVALPEGETTIATVAAQVGYETAYCGPWSVVDATAENPTAYISDRARRPFALLLAFDGPGGWAARVRNDSDRYQPGQFRLRFNVSAAEAGPAQRDWAAYYEACSVVDDWIGSVLDALDERGLSKDTIVVFSSDLGEMLYSHGLRGAGVPYEESVRVPLVIRYPRGVAAGRRINMPVASVDVLPTVLALAGIRAPASIQGRNLTGTARSESVYGQGQLGTPEEWRMVVRGLDKVIVDRDLRVTSLFNLGRDPYESDNLATDKNARRRRDEMSAILQDWMKRASDRILPSGLRLRD